MAYHVIATAEPNDAAELWAARILSSQVNGHNPLIMVVELNRFAWSEREQLKGVL